MAVASAVGKKIVGLGPVVSAADNAAYRWIGKNRPKALELVEDFKRPVISTPRAPMVNGAQRGRLGSVGLRIVSFTPASSEERDLDDLAISRKSS